MKRLVCNSVSLFALIGASSATAADLELKAPAVVVAPLPVWAGCYVGGNLGGVLSWDKFTGGAGSGVLLGGQAGCNYQINWLVVGLEVNAEHVAGDQTNGGTATAGPGLIAQANANLNSVVDIAARTGFAYERFLFFSKAGVAWADYTFKAATLTTTGLTPLAATGADANKTLPGIVGGFGAEYMLTPNLTAKLEADFYYFTRTNIGFACTPGAGINCPNSTSGPAGMATVRTGLNYKF
jgi:outer membrane immunogenic protein